MTKKYLYAQTFYDSLAEANAAAAAKKNALENEPTEYVTVKLLGGNADDGWVVPVEDLTDAEILAIQDGDGNHYGLYSRFEGDMQTGITSTQVNTEITRLKQKFAQLLNATKISVVEDIDPDIDMSSYVTE